MSNHLTSEQNHCRDCCCARSWKALGITEYTGHSIPEHIERLVADRGALLALAKQYAKECSDCDGTGDWNGKPCEACADIWIVINKAEGRV